MTDEQLLALIDYVTKRQRDAIIPDGRGGYSVEHLDAQTALDAFRAQQIQ